MTKANTQGTALTIHVPITLKRRGGRKLVLAPDIVAAILDGCQPRGLSMNVMLKGMPEVWGEQRQNWALPPRC